MMSDYCTNQPTRLISLESVPLTPETLAAQDCVLIATDHNDIDWRDIVRHASVVVGTRGETRGIRKGGNATIVPV